MGTLGFRADLFRRGPFPLFDFSVFAIPVWLGSRKPRGVPDVLRQSQPMTQVGSGPDALKVIGVRWGVKNSRRSTEETFGRTGDPFPKHLWNFPCRTLDLQMHIPVPRPFTATGAPREKSRGPEGKTGGLTLDWAHARGCGNDSDQTIHSMQPLLGSLTLLDWIAAHGGRTKFWGESA